MSAVSGLKARPSGSEGSRFGSGLCSAFGSGLGSAFPAAASAAAFSPLGGRGRFSTFGPGAGLPVTLLRHGSRQGDIGDQGGHQTRPQHRPGCLDLVVAGGERRAGAAQAVPASLSPGRETTARNICLEGLVKGLPPADARD